MEVQGLALPLDRLTFRLHEHRLKFGHGLASYSPERINGGMIAGPQWLEIEQSALPLRRSVVQLHALDLSKAVELLWRQATLHPRQVLRSVVLGLVERFVPPKPLANGTP
jgi:hypothetical protein